MQVAKIGTIYQYTTAAAFSVFTVSPQWITSLWQTCKISKSTAEAEFVKTKQSIRAYLDNVKFHTQCERQDVIAARKALALAAVAPLKKAAIRLDQVEQDFLPQFRRPMFRRRFLVLVGPTQIGKTIYARSLFGDQATLEVNCAGVLEPDLRDFDVCKHRAIVLDEASCQMCLKHKKVMQGGIEEVTLGHSSTNIYSYKVFLHEIALVVTSNTWLQELAALDPVDQQWLAGNTIVIERESPLYVQD